VENYIKLQGRFKGLTDEQIQEMQKYVIEDFNKCIKRLESVA
ncbi:MAG TPA: pyruvate synthase subunit beta, partial [Clostridiaceae bacterium]|nr:pyruvate synthase subunit beta [Clostridiaceae bacterium]